MFVEKLKSYYLNLGDYGFSPITQASIGISMSYIDALKSGDTRSPFLLCFPDKKYAAIWLSVGVLTNFFLEDYVYSNNRSFVSSLKKKDLVEYYDTVAKVSAIGEDFIKLKFKDEVAITVTKSLYGHLSLTNKNALNIFSTYISNKRKVKGERNAVSKILESDDEITINTKRLKSKVLLIAGRGNTKYLRETLSSRTIYDEKLSTVFNEKENLIIYPTLEKYKDISKQKQAFTEFENILKQAEKVSEISVELSSEFRNLLSSMSTAGYITESIKKQFNFILKNHKNGDALVQSVLDALKKVFPGVQVSLENSNLRAVIINDLEQINTYSNTIETFINHNIPVIILSDRIISRWEEFNYYSNLIDTYPTLLRLNWNRKKIQYLSYNELSKRPNLFLDFDLWEVCCRYASQNITINVFNDDLGLDQSMSKIQRSIKKLDGHEVLKNAYYKLLFPALYLLKNSNSLSEDIGCLIDVFQEQFEVIKPAIANDLVAVIEKLVLNIRAFETNSKQVVEDDVFCQFITQFKGQILNAPIEIEEELLPSDELNRLVFQGFPFNEYFGNFLSNSVNMFFIPGIEINSWPIEGRQTYRYIKNRLVAGYFTDLLHNDSLIPPELLLKNESDWEKEINSFLKMVFQSSSEGEDIEESTDESFLEFSKFKYSGYSSSTNKSSKDELWTCDIIDFTDGTFMFLPKTHTILAEIENKTKESCKQCKLDELHVGARVFTYIKDRKTNIQLASKDAEAEKAWKVLEVWRNALECLVEEYDNDYSELSKHLNQLKDSQSLDGNPSVINLKRWYEGDTIMPEDKNVRIILLANNVSDIENNIKKMKAAQAFIIQFFKTLFKKITKEIKDYIKINAQEVDGFKIKIYGEEIDVETRVIASIFITEELKPYYYTKKILK